MDENTGFITTASNFKGKKGERFAIQVSARDNHGRIPTNEALEEATVQVMYHDDFVATLQDNNLGTNSHSFLCARQEHLCPDHHPQTM